MKKIITFIFMLIAVNAMTYAQTNLLKNGGFEDDPATFTVIEETNNVLRRVESHQATVTETVNPTSDPIDVSDKVWYKKAANSSKIKAILTSDDFQEGSKAMHMKIEPGQNVNNLISWWGFVIQQRLPIGTLDNSKKYSVSFYAKLDDAADNHAQKIYTLISDGENNYAQNKDITGTGVALSTTEWKEIKMEFDLPNYIKKNSTADFSQIAYFYLSLTTTNKEDKTPNYAGVLIDNIVLQEEVTNTIFEKEASAFKYSISNGNLVLFNLQSGDKVAIYDLTGKTICNTVTTNENVSINVDKGLYLVKVNNSVQKIVVK